MRSVVAIIGVCCAAMALAASVPAARTTAAQSATRASAPVQEMNLKVLPKTWTAQQVRQLMQTFTESLDVQCTYCHMPDPNAALPAPGGRGPQLNYALDTKEEKEIARKMIRMVMTLNADSLKGVGDPAVPEKVTCYTCHAGAEFPMKTPKNGWGRGSFTLLPAGPGRGAAPPAPPAGR